MSKELTSGLKRSFDITQMIFLLFMVSVLGLCVRAEDMAAFHELMVLANNSGEKGKSAPSIDQFRSVVPYLKGDVAWTAPYDIERLAAQYAGDLANSEEYQRDAGALVKMIESYLIPVYGPRLTQPGQTHMMNPFGVVFVIRQENTVTVSGYGYPAMGSDDFHLHSHGARKMLFEGVEIATGTPTQKISSGLGLKYDIGLQEWIYDPLKTTLRYQNGNLSFQVMNKAAIHVSSDDITMTLSFKKPMLTEGNLLYDKVTTRGADIYYGFAFPKGVNLSSAKEGVQCCAFEVIWGNTREDILKLAEKIEETPLCPQQEWKDYISDHVEVFGDKDLSDLVKLNQQALLTMQMVPGPVLASLDTDYLYTWIRDTTNAVVFESLAGNPQLLAKWAPYLMKNHTPFEYKGKTYNTFFTFPGAVHEDYGKLEQDGPFYAALSCYAYWKLLGNDSYLSEWYPKLVSAMEYLRDSSFDEELGLFWEIYINEHSFKDAPEFGLDHPALTFDGELIRHHFGIYTNHINYANYLMLAEMADTLGRQPDKQHFLGYAQRLHQAIEKNLWDTGKGYYYGGLLRLESGAIKPVDFYFHNVFFDYIWALSLFPMTPDPEKSIGSMTALMTQRKLPLNNGRYYEGSDTFAPGWSHASYVFSAFGDHQLARRCLIPNINAAQSVGNNPLPQWLDGTEPGAWWNSAGRAKTMDAIYMMLGTITERTDMCTPHRPEAFGIGPFLQAAISTGCVMDYHGLTVNPSKQLNHISNVQFAGGAFSIDTAVPNTIGGLVVNQKKVPYTLKVPAEYLTPGRHRVSILDEKSGPVLMYTPFALQKVTAEEERILYRLSGFGMGTLRFSEWLNEKEIQVQTQDGMPLKWHYWKSGNQCHIQVFAEGNFRVSIKK